MSSDLEARLAEDLPSTFTRIFAFFLVGGILLGAGYLDFRRSRRA